MGAQLANRKMSVSSNAVVEIHNAAIERNVEHDQDTSHQYTRGFEQDRTGTGQYGDLAAP